MRCLTVLFVLIFINVGCGKDEGGGIGGFFGVKMWPLTEAGGNAPSWSPDGRDIVYASNQDLWLIPSSGGDPVKITTMSGAERNPVWHPDPGNREIVFINNPDPDTFVIYTLQVDGGEPREMLSTSVNITTPSFTNSGDRIAYAVNKKGEGIYLLPMDGGEAVQLDNSDRWEIVTTARCSPVEAKIAYVENRANDFNIFLLSLSGGKPTNLTQYRNTVGDINKLWYVDWSKDGLELVFTHSANLYTYTSAVFTIPQSGGEPRAWTEDPIDGVVRYDTPSYSPDGDRLVCSHAGQLWILQLR